MRILIADDDKVSRDYLLRVLEKFGTCDLATNGIEAVDAFLLALDENQPYDMICLDVMMPIYDGGKALGTIRKMERKRGVSPSERSKIVITSALNNDELVSKLALDGFDAYLTKPIDAGKLISLMTQFA